MSEDWKTEYPLGALLVKGFQTVAELFIYSAVVFITWNFVMPHLGIIKLDSYWYAVALFILSRFLLNDHILEKEPIVIHCGCGEPEPVEEKK